MWDRLVASLLSISFALGLAGLDFCVSRLVPGVLEIASAKSGLFEFVAPVTQSS